MTVGAAFNGSTSVIITGGTDLTIGAFTIGGVYYEGNAGGSGGLLVTDLGSNNGLAIINNGGTWFLAITNVTFVTGPAVISGYQAIYCTKATGSVTPRFHVYNGSSWSHTNASGAIANPNGAITRMIVGQDNVGTTPLTGEIACLGIWNEDTTDGTIETYLDYSVLAAKTNQQFFTSQSLINAGTLDDSSANNNDETSRTAISAGSQAVPAWFTNFGDGIVPPTPISMEQDGGNSAGGTTSLTIPYPVTGLAAGDLFLVGRTVKPSTATVTTPPSPFTALANTTGGTGSQGTDTGPQRVSTEYLISPSGAESGNLTTAQAGTPNSAVGHMLRFRKPNGTYWAVPIVATADDSSHGTARSAAAGSTIDLQPGDMLVAFFGSDTDTTTAFTAAGFTGTGLTVGTVTIDQGAGGVGTGQDSGIYVTHALVTAASGATTITATLTGGPSSCGPIHIIRLRAIYPVHYGRRPFRPGRIVPLMASRRR